MAKVITKKNKTRITLDTNIEAAIVYGKHNIRLVFPPGFEELDQKGLEEIFQLNQNLGLAEDALNDVQTLVEKSRGQE